MDKINVEPMITFHAVSDHLEAAATCRQAQDIAYGCATRLYPNMASGIKTPPYLIWPGPNLPVAPDIPGAGLYRSEGRAQTKRPVGCYSVSHVVE